MSKYPFKGTNEKYPSQNWNNNIQLLEVMPDKEIFLDNSVSYILSYKMGNRIAFCS